MAKPPVRIIVNADDLGASAPVNDAIFDCIAAGRISSATIMGTGPAVDAAGRTAQRFPRASFGVHMNLTTHAPLTSNPALQPLVGPDGLFRPKGAFDVRWTSRLVDAVADEWVAQVNRVRVTGVEVSHLDSHHHVHAIPRLFPALKQVQRRTGIRRVRGTLNVFAPGEAAGVRRRATKAAWLWALRTVYSTRTTDAFADFLTFLRAVREGTFAPPSWPETIELMVHPTDNVEYSGEEAKALERPWLDEVPVRAELIPYSAL